MYQGKSRSFVAWHEARNAEQGAPFLGEAQPLTTEFVHSLAQGLGSRIPVEVLPENVLVRTAEAVVWWTPAAHRTMFFRSTAEDTQSSERQEVPASATRVVRQRPGTVGARAAGECAPQAYDEAAGGAVLQRKRRGWSDLPRNDAIARKMPESRRFHFGSGRSFKVNSRIRPAPGGSPSILADSWDYGRACREAENRFRWSTWLRRIRHSWSS